MQRHSGSALLPQEGKDRGDESGLRDRWENVLAFLRAFESNRNLPDADLRNSTHEAFWVTPYGMMIPWAGLDKDACKFFVGESCEGPFKREGRRIVKFSYPMEVQRMYPSVRFSQKNTVEESVVDFFPGILQSKMGANGAVRRVQISRGLHQVRHQDCLTQIKTTSKLSRYFLLRHVYSFCFQNTLSQQAIFNLSSSEKFIRAAKYTGKTPRKKP